jgi:Spermine/spermidine synthase domain
LLALSFLSLFMELALIRWAGSNIVYLSYFSNFVLLASFLGLGLGFLLAQRRVRLFTYLLPTLGVFVLAALAGGLSIQVPESTGDVVFFTGGQSSLTAPVGAVLPIVFVWITAIMACVGQELARSFRLLPALEAYRIDIAGSLTGIVAFTLLSFLGAPPLMWGLVVALGVLSLGSTRPSRLQAAGAACFLAALAVESFHPGSAWSPYYKVQWVDLGSGTTAVSVNGVPHQVAHAVDRLRSDPDPYLAPYQLMGTRLPGDVLIVGAGTGNDVAIALYQGASHIDAVEIDPELQRLGASLHPDHPYQDPRVSVHIDDGRAFLQRTTSTYDLILFALPDSLTLVSGQSSLRLESYLFTAEASAAARAHLRPDGVFAEYNYFRQEWLVDRLAGTLQDAYAQAPCVLQEIGKTPGVGFAVLVDSLDPAQIACSVRWQRPAGTAAPSRDDQPFLYVRGSLPSFYAIALILILLAAALATLLVGSPVSLVPYADLFFMGAAFLLLETKNVVQFALLFGTTWFVNALVFAGILVTVALAIEVSRRWKIPGPTTFYLLLFVALAAAWLVPPAYLLALPFVPRLLGASALAFGPVFVANLAFAQRFRDAGDSLKAFAANLLGAILGGCLEYSALVIGYRDLLLVAGVLYVLAFILYRRGLHPAIIGRPWAV